METLKKKKQLQNLEMESDTSEEEDNAEEEAEEEDEEDEEVEEDEEDEESEVGEEEQSISSEQESESHEQRSSVQSELRSMSFAELIKLKETLGSKIYNEAMFGDTNERQKLGKQLQKQKFKRENKNRPREETAKKQVPLLGKRKSNDSAGTAPRDPRFDSNCGTFDRSQFKEDYSFVSEIREKELNELKAQLKVTTDPDEKTKIKLLIQRMNNQNLEEKKLKERKMVELSERRNVQKAIKSNQKPFFVSKSEKKAEELVKQYLELKNSGKLNKHLERRRKKNAARDRKKYKFD